MQSLEFRIDPWFVHRPLAAQALAVDGDAPLGALADEIVRAAVSAGVADVRTAAATGRLAQLVNRPVTVRAGFYFSPVTVDGRARIRFHDRVKVDDSVHVRVEGSFDPDRYEAGTGPSGRQHAYLVGLVRSFQPEGNVVELRPLLIGFPYFAPAGQAVDPRSARQWAEISPGAIEQFGLDEKDLGRAATAAQLNRVFALPRERVQQAFATILGVPGASEDRSGEASDLVADVTADGVTGRCAFVFTGPGGRPAPWTLYPGELGDRGTRLFGEPADIYAIQHCSRIAESVRHLMEALAVRNRTRYLLVDGDLTFKILRRAQLLD